MGAFKSIFSIKIYKRLFSIQTLKRIKIIISFLLIIIFFFFWPQRELDAGEGHIKWLGKDGLKYYVEYMSNIRRIRSFGNETIFYDVFDKANKETVTIFNHNGYISLRFYNDNKTKRRESLFGVLPSLFSKENKKALVLGLGSGITASAVSEFYQSTKVFEVNSTMKKVAYRLRDKNRNLLKKKHVEILIQDAFIGTYLEEDNSYDIINHTISNLDYYAASKTFSQEFFKIAKKKLKKKGVFSLWYDSRRSLSSIDTVYNTLLSVFNECRTFLLSSYYHIVICGENLKLKSPTNLNIEDKFIKEVISYTPFLEVDAQKYFGQKKYSAEINTLDKLRTNHKIFYHRYNRGEKYDSRPDQMDSFNELIWSILNNPNNNPLKICEALHFFGYFWRNCNEF